MSNITVYPVSDSDKSRPFWSVIIPTYNCSKYLSETIQSVLDQDRGSENMEIWVVDDHSSDHPNVIVEQLGKGRINFYRQEKNIGQLNNFDTCLNIARGHVIHLLHGDDFVHDGFYENLEKAFSQNYNVGAAFTAHQTVDEEGHVKKKSAILSNESGILKNFIYSIASGQLIQTPSIVVKRNVYEKIGGFNRNLTCLEDWEMWIRIANSYNFYYVPKNLASYRNHTNSSTEESIKSGRLFNDVLNCTKIYSQYLNISKKDIQIAINAAKQYFLDYAVYLSFLRGSPLILLRSTKLVYDYKSFFKIVSKFPKAYFGLKISRLKIYLGELKQKLIYKSSKQ